MLTDATGCDEEDKSLDAYFVPLYCKDLDGVTDADLVELGRDTLRRIMRDLEQVGTASDEDLGSAIQTMIPMLGRIMRDEKAAPRDRRDAARALFDCGQYEEEVRNLLAVLSVSTCGAGKRRCDCPRAS